MEIEISASCLESLSRFPREYKQLVHYIVQGLSDVRCKQKLVEHNMTFPVPIQQAVINAANWLSIPGSTYEERRANLRQVGRWFFRSSASPTR